MSEPRKMRRARHRAQRVKAAKRERAQRDRSAALQAATLCDHPAAPDGVGGDGYAPLVECRACGAVVGWVSFDLDASGPREVAIRGWSAPGFERDYERALQRVIGGGRK